MKIEISADELAYIVETLDESIGRLEWKHSVWVESEKETNEDADWHPDNTRRGRELQERLARQLLRQQQMEAGVRSMLSREALGRMAVSPDTVTRKWALTELQGESES